MAVEPLSANMYLLRHGAWQSYLWRDADGVTLVDAGAAGSGPLLLRDLAALGLAGSDVDRLVLTHFHDDHCGGAAEVAAWGAVEVLAHAHDAPIIRGERDGPPPRYHSDDERELHAQVAADLPPAPPSRVNREVRDGDVLEMPSGSRIIHTPGHTRGSLALYLPTHRLLLTGDTVAEHQGQIVLGPFNLDREEAMESFRVLAALDVDVACFGHGRPVMTDAGKALAAAAVNPIALS